MEKVEYLPTKSVKKCPAVIDEHVINPIHMKTLFAVVLCVLVVAGGYAQCSRGSIDQETVTASCDGTYSVNGKVDGRSNATITSSKGDVVVSNKIDGQSTVVIDAPNGNVRIGWVIDGSSNVTIRCKGSVTIDGKIDGKSIVKIICGGNITIGEKIDGESQCDFNTRGDILINDRVGNPNTVIRWHGKSFKANNGVDGAQIVNY